MRAIRAAIGWFFSLAAICAALVLGLITLRQLDGRPRTDDAFLQADLVKMAPDVSGRITELHVSEDQAVRIGDVLFVIEQEQFRLRVDAASASVRQLEAMLADAGRQIASQASRAEAAALSIEGAQAALSQSTATLARMQPLLVHGYVSAEQVDQARTAQRSAEVTLSQSKQQAVAAKESISSTRPLEEQLAGARATLGIAERDLRLSVVRAPCNGRVVGLNIAVGTYAREGSPVFTLINTDRWYAVGNFRETDLSGITLGQSAKVFALAEPNAILTGTIVGIGSGVQPGQGAESNGLPEISRSLNWVRIAQRFPVRILLATTPADLMKVGASAVIVIDRAP